VAKSHLALIKIDQEQKQVNKKDLVRQMLVEKYQVAEDIEPAHLRA